MPSRERTRAALALITLVGASCTPLASQDRAAIHAAETRSLRGVLDGGAPPPGTLRVRLAFPARADLDLFVTDPAHETVYFANSPSRSGGQLERDVRCDDPAPRVETVVFPDAAPGRYRVGVDYPKPCEGHEGEASFVVAVDGRGPTETRQGRIAPGIFQPIVLEVQR